MKAFLHASGALLALLLLVHLASVHHFSERADDGSGFPASWQAAQARLSNPFWRFWDATTFLVAVGHAAAGFSLLLDRRVAAPRLRAGARSALLLLAFVVAVLATYAYLTLPLGFRNPAFGGP